MLSSAFL